MLLKTEDERRADIVNVWNNYQLGNGIEYHTIHDTWIDIDSLTLDDLLKFPAYYRVVGEKPQPSYEPYSVPDNWMIGRTLMKKDTDFPEVGIIEGHKRFNVMINAWWYDLDTLFRDWQHLDGTPFGKVVE